MQCMAHKITSVRATFHTPSREIDLPRCERAREYRVNGWDSCGSHLTTALHELVDAGQFVDDTVPVTVY